MDVRFAGGLHYDPASRPACIRWMRALLDSDGKPSLVAVEWDRGIEAKREREREDFKERWGRFRKQDPPELVKAIADSIAWESDVFDEVFGHLPVVWLDDGRNELPRSRPLGRNRRLDCEYILAPDPAERASEDVLPRLHEYWLEDAETTQAELVKKGRDAGRDQKWAEALQSKLGTGTWALIIVGALHASDWDDQTLFSLLKAKGHNCVTEFLLWKPTRPAKS